MECVCGCGTDLAGKLRQRNFIAASVALELLVWDRNRAGPTPGPDGREGLIARGSDCYQRLLYSLHGQGGDPDGDCEAWVAESAAMRADLPEMTRQRLLGDSRPNLSKSDMALLDRKHPELSFTGRVGAAVGTATPDKPMTRLEPDLDPGAPTEDIVERLERLRALREDGFLTDEEFTAAKARLLG